MNNHLSFDCVVNGERCSKCCEAIHVTKAAGDIIKGVSKLRSLHQDDEVIQKYWVQITKRQAKKINPYMFSSGWGKDVKKWLSQAVFFKCTALIDGQCSIYDHRPNICREFSGNGMYAYECAQENYEKSQIIVTDAEK